MPKKGSGQAWDDSVKLAKELLSGNFKPITKHTHYYAPKIVTPTWAFKKTAAGKVRRLYQDIGNHRFLSI
jgi:spore germination cell wall hydrolase CwlJ-like protein